MSESKGSRRASFESTFLMTLSTAILCLAVEGWLVGVDIGGVGAVNVKGPLYLRKSHISLS